MLRALLFLVLASGSAAAQSPTSVVPDAGTIGTTLVLSGTGFGVQRGSLLLLGLDGAPDRKLAVVAWSDTAIEARILRAPSAGATLLEVRPKLGGSGQIPFTVLAPTALALDKTLASPRELVRLSVADLGPRRPRVCVGWKRVPIRSVKDDPGQPGVRIVRFRIPRHALPTGVWSVSVSNAVGEDVLETALQITGSKRRWVHRPRVEGLIDGEAFHARASRSKELVGDDLLWVVRGRPSSPKGPTGELDVRFTPPPGVPTVFSGPPVDLGQVTWTAEINGEERVWTSVGGAVALTLQAVTKRQVAGILQATLVSPGQPDLLVDAAFVALRP